jgi:hypothetical protein
VQTSPRVFLCHGSEDKQFASGLATRFMQQGVETFLDAWEIRTGDSLRQRIEEGISGCTHFLALLTPNSITRPWVNAEMDAGFIQKLEGRCKFLPVLKGLGIDTLPPLLRSLRCKAIDGERGIDELINDIRGISIKPPLGPQPSIVALSTLASQASLSLAATQVAELLSKSSDKGREHDPFLEVDAIVVKTGLPVSDLRLAVDELEEHGLAKANHVGGCPPLGYHLVCPTEFLFEQLDHAFMGWNPMVDARSVAVALVNGGQESGSVQDIAEQLGWTPRRMNPAVSYLLRYGIVGNSRGMNPTYVCSVLLCTAKTHRFVRDGE